jgi:hypothetical protein
MLPIVRAVVSPSAGSSVRGVGEVLSVAQHLEPRRVAQDGVRLAFPDRECRRGQAKPLGEQVTAVDRMLRPQFAISRVRAGEASSHIFLELGG